MPFKERGASPGVRVADPSPRTGWRHVDSPSPPPQAASPRLRSPRRSTVAKEGCPGAAAQSPRPDEGLFAPSPRSRSPVMSTSPSGRMARSRSPDRPLSPGGSTFKQISAFGGEPSVPAASPTRAPKWQEVLARAKEVRLRAMGYQSETDLEDGPSILPKNECRRHRNSLPAALSRQPEASMNLDLQSLSSSPRSSPRRSIWAADRMRSQILSALPSGSSPGPLHRRASDGSERDRRCSDWGEKVAEVMSLESRGALAAGKLGSQTECSSERQPSASPEGGRRRLRSEIDFSPERAGATELTRNPSQRAAATLALSARGGARVAAEKQSSQIEFAPARSRSCSLTSVVAPWVAPHYEGTKQSKQEMWNYHNFWGKDKGGNVNYNDYTDVAEKFGVGEYSPKNPNQSPSSATTKRQTLHSLALFGCPINVDTTDVKAAPHSIDVNSEEQPAAGQGGRAMAKDQSFQTASVFCPANDIDGNFKRRIGSFSPNRHVTREISSQPGANDPHAALFDAAVSCMADRVALGRGEQATDARRLDRELDARKMAIPVVPVEVVKEESAALSSAVLDQQVEVTPVDYAQLLKDESVPMAATNAELDDDLPPLVPIARPLTLSSSARNLFGDPSAFTSCGGLTPPGLFSARSISSASTSCGGLTPPGQRADAEAHFFLNQKRSAVAAASKQPAWSFSQAKRLAGQNSDGNKSIYIGGYTQVSAGVVNSRYGPPPTVSIQRQELRSSSKESRSSSKEAMRKSPFGSKAPHRRLSSDFSKEMTGGGSLGNLSMATTAASMTSLIRRDEQCRRGAELENNRWCKGAQSWASLS